MSTLHRSLARRGATCKRARPTQGKQTVAWRQAALRCRSAVRTRQPRIPAYTASAVKCEVEGATPAATTHLQGRSVATIPRQQLGTPALPTQYGEPRLWEAPAPAIAAGALTLVAAYHLARSGRRGHCQLALYARRLSSAPMPLFVARVRPRFESSRGDVVVERDKMGWTVTQVILRDDMTNASLGPAEPAAAAAGRLLLRPWDEPEWGYMGYSTPPQQ